MINLGFTGTQTGMTLEQKAAVRGLLPQVEFTLHHGDCIGADAQVHELCRTRPKLARIVIHPPVNQDKRACCSLEPEFAGFAIMPRRPYLDRNKRIVVAGVDGLIGTPKEMSEPARLRAGGTWATIRMARRAGRFIAIVWPDGTISMENGTKTWDLFLF